ncbi:MAG: DNA repair exonuclease [Rhodospirillaceae bacterium]
MRFIHAADIHLDSPLSGLTARAEGRATRLAGATRRAFHGLIGFALEQRVDFMVIAGDLFDGDWPDFSTGLAFAEGMGRLAQAGIRVAIVRGNHDAESKMTRKLSLPPTVTMFGARKAETLVWDDLGVALHGRSFGQGHESANLARDYPPARPGLFNIGLLHTAATGRPGHEGYAPCSLEDLVARGYDYWALGHVHAREELSREPWIVFSGNLQGRHANETGAKGCTLVTVEAGRVVSVEAVDLDVVRWVRCEIDLAVCGDWDDLAEAVRAALARELAAAGGRTLAARLTLSGRSRLHRRLAGDPERAASECANGAAQAGDVWIERVITRTTDPAASAGGAPGALTDLIGAIEAVRTAPAEREALRAGIETLLGRIPAEIRGIAGLGDLTDDALAGLLADAGALLLDRLFDDQGT